MNFAEVQPLLDVLRFKTVLRRKLTAANLGANNNVLSIFLSGLLVAIGYYLGLQVGFALKPPNRPISVFWPPNAILMAAFLIVPRKRWWLLVLAVLPVHLLVQLSNGVPVSTSLGWFLGNVGEGLLGAYLITEIQNVRDSFERVRGLLIFLACGVFAAPLLTSFLDIGVVIVTGVGRDFWYLWANRQLSNMLAELTVVPTIVLFYMHGTEWLLKARWTKYLEALLLALVVVAAAVYAFSPGLSQTGRTYSFYALLLLLAWATLRFQFAGLSTTLLAVSLFSSWAVVHDRAPFLASPDNVIPVQVFLFLVALPSMFIAAVLVQQHETANSLRTSKLQLVNSQEQERSRIARELHDGVGQLLSLVEIELSQLEEECDAGMRPKLENLGQQLAEVSQLTHEISHGLHPSHLEYLGLSVAVKRLCTDFAKDNVLTIDFHEANVPEHLDPNVSLSLYRVAQEALHNAAKYSRAQRIQVRLRMKSGGLWLEVSDDGIGFTKKNRGSEGIGLMSMQERMESIGGTVLIRSAPGKGTSVHASVPYIVRQESVQSLEDSEKQLDRFVHEEIERDDSQSQRYCG